jgi:hypothetical protein
MLWTDSTEFVPMSGAKSGMVKIAALFRSKKSAKRHVPRRGPVVLSPLVQILN